MSKIFISDTNISMRKPFIYCICILKPTAFVYIGQSAQKRGVLGRFLEHTDNEGTLTKKAREAGVMDFKDITVVAIDLSDYKDFDGLYSRPRNALEFLVHTSMKAKGCKASIPFEVISYVTNSSLIHQDSIQKLAQEITDKICNETPFFKE